MLDCAHLGVEVKSRVVPAGFETMHMRGEMVEVAVISMVVQTVIARMGMLNVIMTITKPTSHNWS